MSNEFEAQVHFPGGEPDTTLMMDLAQLRRAFRILKNLLPANVSPEFITFEVRTTDKQTYRIEVQAAPAATQSVTPKPSPTPPPVCPPLGEHPRRVHRRVQE